LLFFRSIFYFRFLLTTLRYPLTPITMIPPSRWAMVCGKWPRYHRPRVPLRRALGKLQPIACRRGSQALNSSVAIPPHQILSMYSVHQSPLYVRTPWTTGPPSRPHRASPSSPSATIWHHHKHSWAVRKGIERCRMRPKCRSASHWPGHRRRGPSAQRRYPLHRTPNIFLEKNQSSSKCTSHLGKRKKSRASHPRLRRRSRPCRFNSDHITL
jgi:hypothetical protein